MAYTYPSLSVKGMIYIHSGSPHICVSSQKNTQGRRGRLEDPVYTACGPKICMGTMVYEVFKSQMHNFDGPRQVHYKLNTVPDSKPGSIPMMSVSQLRGGSEGGGSHACAQTLFCLAWDTFVYIYIHLYIYTPI